MRPEARPSQLRCTPGASGSPSYQQFENNPDAGLFAAFWTVFVWPLLLEIPVTPRLTCCRRLHCRIVNLITCIRPNIGDFPAKATGLSGAVDQGLTYT